MKHICIGITAHVDAGKTTLSEAMLYQAGALKKLGRVDHRDAFLDTFALERERGITIFSKQAEFSLPHTGVTLLDTPGHVDFSAEMERTLQVLDYAVLVISGTDGVQAHTETLWRLLARHNIPTFLFVNKMDLDGAERVLLLRELKERLSTGVVDFGDGKTLYEELAVCDEALLERYFEVGTVSEADIVSLIRERKAFPCFFGSALRLDGVEALLDALDRCTEQPEPTAAFGARVFKVARDAQGNRLTYMKITGGSLAVRTQLSGEEDGGWQEKVNQLRVYSGEKFTAVERAEPGMVVAATGLTHTAPGMGLGAAAGALPPVLEPVLSYRVGLPEGCDAHTMLQNLRQLEEEDPLLRVVWNEQLGEIHLQLMGEVQLEILTELIETRFGVRVTFDEGSIVYRETIAAPVVGIGHFEPLRHYAEVHLLLEPGERGSGIVLQTACSTDELDLNWQRLILTHLAEKAHLGVLTGSPLTDVCITVVAGRAHVKHTEGGDFREATYRAVRNGLMQAENVLLEPYYDFTLELPDECVGRAMSDIQRMDGTFDAPQPLHGGSVITGKAPVSSMRNYLDRGRLLHQGARASVLHAGRLRGLPQRGRGDRRHRLRRRARHREHGGFGVLLARRRLCRALGRGARARASGHEPASHAGGRSACAGLCAAQRGAFLRFRERQRASRPLRAHLRPHQGPRLRGLSAEPQEGRDARTALRHAHSSGRLPARGRLQYHLFVGRAESDCRRGRQRGA